MTDDPHSPKVRTIRLTDAAYTIASRHAKREQRSISEQVEFWILEAQYGAAGAFTRLEKRNRPGRRVT